MRLARFPRMSEQIARAVNEQTSVVNSVSESVLIIKSNAQENLDAVKLSGKVAEKTVNITRRLDQLTNQFWATRARDLAMRTLN